LLELLGTHPIFHVSKIRVKLSLFIVRVMMSALMHSCLENAEQLNTKACGTYNYHCALNVKYISFKMKLIMCAVW